MKGEASRATTAISPMADRHPGSARAARIPSAMRETKLAPRWRRAGLGSLTMARATTTAAKEAALTAKTSP